MHIDTVTYKDAADELMIFRRSTIEIPHIQWHYVCTSYLTEHFSLLSSKEVAFFSTWERVVFPHTLYTMLSIYQEFRFISPLFTAPTLHFPTCFFISYMPFLWHIMLPTNSMMLSLSFEHRAALAAASNNTVTSQQQSHYWLPPPRFICTYTSTTTKVTQPRTMNAEALEDMDASSGWPLPHKLPLWTLNYLRTPLLFPPPTYTFLYHYLAFGNTQYW